MDAVIDQHKPTVRIASPAPMPWASEERDTRCRSIAPEMLVAPGARVVMVAPHPDDEILALGATLATLAAAGHEILIVAVTDGEGSHPRSHRWTGERLRETRPRESHHALRELGIAAEILRLGLPDGNVQGAEKMLAELLPLGTADTVFVPWRHDGHADHEACARATLAACRTVGARCVEFPVWSLVASHAAHAGLLQRNLVRVRVAPDRIASKCRAMQAFCSQIEPDGDSAAVLQHDALATWQGADEWVLA